MKKYKSVLRFFYASSSVVLFIYTICNRENLSGIIFAMTIASAIFTTADLISTGVDIWKKRKDAIFTNILLCKILEKIYMKKMEKKYGSDTERKWIFLERVLGEETYKKILSADLTQEEKNDYLGKVDDKEAKKFLADYLEIEKEINNESEEEVMEVHEYLEEAEKIYTNILGTFPVIALVSIIFIIGLKTVPNAGVSDILTIGTFFLVIMNVWLKEGCINKKMEELLEMRKKLIQEIIESKLDD